MQPINQIFIDKFNRFVKYETPFVFLIDFEGLKPVIYNLTEAQKAKLFFKTPSFTNYSMPTVLTDKNFEFEIQSVDFRKYEEAFNLVKKHLQKGDTYLLNITVPTEIHFKEDVGLKDIFEKAQAPYKILFKDEFVCFTPETFVKIQNNKIATYPMKGTIDASLPNAKNLLLSDQKESYEHHTIVDLLRNDLAQIATNIKVTKFKYLDKITSPSGELFQMSSEISGDLPQNWRENAVEIFLKLLPGGSISGAPKNKTIEIIKNAEGLERGYYTGIFGYFDGLNFDTAVMIRYIEKNLNKFIYRSGGGITALSQLEKEYNELIQKIYVPTS
jgi:para-aminobenzoate synthetase component 1